MDPREFVKDMSKLEGLPPFESSPCRNDKFYAKSLERKYGRSIDDLKKIFTSLRKR